jgi:TRAP-type C4-dicarboxylate transport system permease small subunit
MSIMIKMSLVYSVIPLSGLFMIINSVENIFEDVKLYKETRDK